MKKKLVNTCLLVCSLLLAGSGSLAAQSVKVMSYNIHHGTDAREKPTLEAMGAFIKASGAALVGLQEVDSLCGRSGKVDQMKELARITGMHYAFYRHFAYDGGAYGLGILSRYPIIEQRNQRISSLQKGKMTSLAFLSVKVKAGQEELLFATVHLALDQPTRMTQAREVMDYLKGEPSVILTGDMNALADTPEMQLIGSRLSAADNPDLLSFPAIKAVKKIDYIFCSQKLKANRKKARVYPEIRYSDHLPLVANLRLQGR